MRVSNKRYRRFDFLNQLGADEDRRQDHCDQDEQDEDEGRNMAILDSVPQPIMKGMQNISEKQRKKKVVEIGVKKEDHPQKSGTDADYKEEFFLGHRISRGRQEGLDSKKVIATTSYEENGVPPLGRTDLEVLTFSGAALFRG